MRHRATLLTELEGFNRYAFRVAQELCHNSRSGLTVRFLAKKLDLPQEEIEYLLDVHTNLFFTDLTKVKLVTEGTALVRRIEEGLENRGDAASIPSYVKRLDPHSYRVLEDRFGLEDAITKKALGERVLNECYRHPDSIVEYVASRDFSSTAQEIFDIVWQSEEGVMSVSAIQAIHGGSEQAVEQGLWELFSGLALFEMFRFDSEDRLKRVAGLLTEIRKWRAHGHKAPGRTPKLKPLTGKANNIDARGLSFSQSIAAVVAAIAAKPVRIRSDAELWREDYRRLAEIVEDGSDPSLRTCLWAAQGLGWIAQVDNELRVANFDELQGLSRLERHCLVFDWMTGRSADPGVRHLAARLLDAAAPGAWYAVNDFVAHVMAHQMEEERPVLRVHNGQYQYVTPGAERGIVRALEESLHWLGVVDRAEAGGDTLFRLTELGAWLLGEDRGRIEPPAVDGHHSEIVVQPNFDIVVMSRDADPLALAPLERFAERKGFGAAAVYHLSKSSFTRGVQEGHDVDAFFDFLLKHNREDTLPANVLSTLETWRGGMKQVRIRTLHVIEAEDPIVMAELRSRRALGEHIQSIDSQRTAAFSKIGKKELIKRLEKEGFVVN